MRSTAVESASRDAGVKLSYGRDSQQPLAGPLASAPQATTAMSAPKSTSVGHGASSFVHRQQSSTSSFGQHLQQQQQHPQQHPQQLQQQQNHLKDPKHAQPPQKRTQQPYLYPSLSLPMSSRHYSQLAQFHQQQQRLRAQLAALQAAGGTVQPQLRQQQQVHSPYLDALPVPEVGSRSRIYSLPTQPQLPGQQQRHFASAQQPLPNSIPSSGHLLIRPSGLSGSSSSLGSHNAVSFAGGAAAQLYRQHPSWQLQGSTTAFNPSQFGVVQGTGTGATTPCSTNAPSAAVGAPSSFVGAPHYARTGQIGDQHRGLLGGNPKSTGTGGLTSLALNAHNNPHFYPAALHAAAAAGGTCWHFHGAFFHWLGG